MLTYRFGANTTAAEIQAREAVGLGQKGIRAFADTAHHLSQAPSIPWPMGPTDLREKRWRYLFASPAHWDLESIRVLLFMRDTESTFSWWEFSREADVVELDALSHSVINFFEAYTRAGHPRFSRIPKLQVAAIPRAEAYRMQFNGRQPPIDYPITILSRRFTNGEVEEIVPNLGEWAYLFNSAGEPEMFLYQDFIRENPLDWNPQTPPVPGERLSDGDFIEVASDILSRTGEPAGMRRQRIAKIV